MRRNRKRFENALKDILTIALNNDPEGDCGMAAAFQFDNADAAYSFGEKAGGWRPINTGRHVYSNC